MGIIKLFGLKDDKGNEYEVVVEKNRFKSRNLIRALWWWNDKIEVGRETWDAIRILPVSPKDKTLKIKD
jgi:hypothetical protein